MIVQTVREIDLDVSNNQYIKLDVKQYDRNTRYILITCYHQGEFIPINKTSHFASIRYWKPDEKGVFNACEITEDGKILVELTEQMLAVAGLCYVDVVIHESVNLSVDIVEKEDGSVEIVDVGNSGIISTMTFVVYVHEAAFDNELVESSYEYNALNDLLGEARRNYVDVINACYTYKLAAEDARDKAKISEQNAKASEDNAKISEINAKVSEDNAKLSEDNAKISETNAKVSEDNAKLSETNAKVSEDNAKVSEDNAKLSETNAKISEQNAKLSETNAKTSEDNAKLSETNAKTSEDNAHNYCETVKSVVDGLNSGFIPIGTISFSELATAEKATGFTYNINEDFITDDTFREGAGMTYTAGTNVYYTADNKWDCFGGSASSPATLDEVKDYLGI